MNKDQIILDFFNFEKPCPSHVNSCEELRLKYKEEAASMSKAGCSGCKQNALRAKYISRVWEAYVTQNL
jgi:hypothetical protein